jgi:surface polysaccharide O-acyltransferase-like enzyme
VGVIKDLASHDIDLTAWVAQTLLDTLQLQMVLGYAVYFALGYLLQQMLITRRIALVAAVVGVVGIVATVVGTSLLSLRGGEPDGTLYGYLTPNVLVVAVAVFCVVTYVVENHARPRAPRAIAVVAGASFGIYLVHPLFQSLLEWAGITGATGGAAIGVPAVSVVIFAVSLLSSLLIRRIPRVGTWVS